MKRIWRERISLTFFASAFIGPGIQFAKIYLFHLMLAPAFWLSLKQVREHGWQPLPVPLKFFSAYLLWAVASLLWTIELSTSIKLTVVLSMGSFLVFIIPQIWRDNDLLPKLGRVFVAIWIAQLVFGLLEIFTTFRYPISRFAMTNHLFGLNYIEGGYGPNHPVWRDLPTGLSWSPNTYSTFLVLCCSFLPVLRVSKKIKAILFALTFTAFAFEGSKTCLFGALLVMFLWGLYYVSETQIERRWLFVTAALCLASVIAILWVRPGFLIETKKIYTTLQSAIQSRGEIKSESHLSVTKRFIWYENAFNSVFHRPLLGAGIGTAGSTQIHSQYDKPVSLHFFFLEPLVELGVIGFSLFLLAYCSMISLLARMRTKLSIATAIALVAFVPASMSLSSGIYFLPWYFIFGFGAALLAINTANTRSKSYKQRAAHS